MISQVITEKMDVGIFIGALLVIVVLSWYLSVLIRSRHL
jgi:hypothetical protein